MDVKKAYRFRFYPTPEQEQNLAKTFGCARFAYNHMLRIRTDAWYKEQKRVGYHDTSALLTELKKQPETIWLNEVSSVPVQQSLRHLQTAFGNFFAKRTKYPTFKSKHDKQAAEYTSSAFKWDGKALKLAKMDAPLNIRWSRTLPKAAKLTTATVSKDAAGRVLRPPSALAPFSPAWCGRPSGQGDLQLQAVVGKIHVSGQAHAVVHIVYVVAQMGEEARPGPQFVRQTATEAFLHDTGQGRPVEIWLKIELAPWFTGFSSPPDEDGDGFPEIYGRVADTHHAPCADAGRCVRHQDHRL